MTVRQVLLDLAHHPIRGLVLRWHWKSALLSAMVRGGLFFATNIPAGRGPAAHATLVEFALCVPAAGLLAAVAQTLGPAEPQWLSALVAAVFLPTLAQGAEFGVHWLARTPELGASVAASIALSVLSTLFSLFVMRRGVMVVGAGSRTLREDLRRLPGLCLTFVLSPVRRADARTSRPPCGP